MINQIHFGDCRESLRAMYAAGVKVQTCVTSPPYFGLRDYGVDGQIGLEPTPDEFIAELVEVFRCVRDVLADDGTLWVNIGDSYCSTAPGTRNAPQTKGCAAKPEQWANARPKTPDGMKPKDLIGIPWMLAKALRDPYYTGKIKREVDRVWLAAMVDGEGCFYIHKRQAGQHAGDGYMRKTDTYSPAFEVANTQLSIIEKCMAIAGVGSIIRQDKDRRQPIYRWTVRSDEARQIAAEIYPHLVAKRQQCRVICAMPNSGDIAVSAWLAMKDLHAGIESKIDFPAPKSMWESGWYLRQEIIWAKPNPMPESVTDRCTKAHEQIFLLSKSPRYFFDHEAIKEPVAKATVARLSQNVAAQRGSDRVPGKTNGPMKAVRSKANSFKREGSKREQVIPGQTVGTHRPDRKESEYDLDTRNRRSVWSVATKPYKGAHFATFPPALIDPCILAGSAPGDVVLDPFMGSGTTAAVAIQHGRQFIGCELNTDYGPLQDQRIAEARGLTAQASLI